MTKDLFKLWQQKGFFTTVVVECHGKVRRAQLYFMRERTVKSACLKQKFD